MFHSDYALVKKGRRWFRGTVCLESEHRGLSKDLSLLSGNKMESLGNEEASGKSDATSSWDGFSRCLLRICV